MDTLGDVRLKTGGQATPVNPPVTPSVNHPANLPVNPPGNQPVDSENPADSPSTTTVTVTLPEDTTLDPQPPTLDPSHEPVTSDLAVDLLNTPVGDSKMTFLHLAGREGHAEVIAALLAEGADPTIRSVMQDSLRYEISQII